MFTDYPKDGLLDGAIFWDTRDLSAHQEIVGIVREGDRLCVVKKKSAYFVLEFLKKKDGAPQWTYPSWSEARSSIVCGSETEAFGLTQSFLKNE